jgi:two-component system, NtrC family, nitrogen regulation response regulator GlnG
MNNEKQHKTGLAQLVETKLKDYFLNLNGHYPVQGLYDQVIQEVEKPLLHITLDFCSGNKLKAAELLGINRNTLSKKLKGLKDKA